MLFEICVIVGLSVFDGYTHCQTQAPQFQHFNGVNNSGFRHFEDMGWNITTDLTQRW